jgi:hypothetical protein
MKTRSNVKAGGLGTLNHNQAMALKTKSKVKAGGLGTLNHNQARA